MTKQLTIFDIVARLQNIADLRQEHFICFSLDSNHQIIEKRTVFIGTLTGVMAHPREIFAGLLLIGRRQSLLFTITHPAKYSPVNKTLA
jgi:DNA repair protein RadC